MKRVRWNWYAARAKSIANPLRFARAAGIVQSFSLPRTTPVVALPGSAVRKGGD